MFKITVNFEEDNKAPVLLKKVKAGQTLLEVLLDHSIEISHVCGGICSCNTCLIHVQKGDQFLEPKFIREEHFLKRNFFAKPDSRLACQCLLLEGKGEIHLTVPEQETSMD